jgi:hypothetical protein
MSEQGPLDISPAAMNDGISETEIAQPAQFSPGACAIAVILVAGGQAAKRRADRRRSCRAFCPDLLARSFQARIFAWCIPLSLPSDSGSCIYIHVHNAGPGCYSCRIDRA